MIIDAKKCLQLNELFEWKDEVSCRRQIFKNFVTKVILKTKYGEKMKFAKYTKIIPKKYSK